MIFSACRRLVTALSLLLLLCAAGCIPTRENAQEEQRDPNFVRGQELRQRQDHTGAAAAFELALEANPRSASAHFELGLLFEQPLNDPAAAIYHFERFLRLRPTSDRAEIVRQRVTNCKIELAKVFLIAPSAPSAQRELDKLKMEVERLGVVNNQLRRQVETLAAQGPTRSAVTPPAPVAVIAAQAPPAPKTATPAAAVARPGVPPSTLAPATDSAKAAKAAPTPRTHTVKQGDIPATIAKQHGLKLEALLAANPDLDPKRMKIGQLLKLPAP